MNNTVTNETTGDSYLRNYIEENRDSFCGMPDEESLLAIKNDVAHIDNMCLNWVYGGHREYSVLETFLGLVKQVRLMYHTQVEVTDKGRELVNGYRASMGNISLEEELENRPAA